MSRYEKITNRVAAKSLKADASAAAMSLLQNTKGQIGELNRIEDFLTREIREIEHRGGGWKLKKELLHVIEELREARSGLMSVMTEARGWATDVEMGFLT